MVRIIRTILNNRKVLFQNNKEDKMAALHAKIIMVDNYKTLISSANLSYHGMSGNIEIGTSLVSAKIAKQIDTLFKDLLFSGVFSLLGE